MTTKQQIQHVLEANEIDHTDVFGQIGYIGSELDDTGLQVSFDSVQGDSDSYVLATYYSNKLKQSIILDWSFKTIFESREELAQAIFDLEQRATQLEESIIINNTI